VQFCDIIFLKRIKVIYILYILYYTYYSILLEIGRMRIQRNVSFGIYFLKIAAIIFQGTYT